MVGGKLGGVGSKFKMIDPVPKAVVKTGPVLGVAGATVLSALAIIIIYATKKTTKKDDANY